MAEKIFICCRFATTRNKIQKPFSRSHSLDLDENIHLAHLGPWNDNCVRMWSEQTCFYNFVLNTLCSSRVYSFKIFSGNSAHSKRLFGCAWRSFNCRSDGTENLIFPSRIVHELRAWKLLNLLSSIRHSENRSANDLESRAIQSFVLAKALHLHTSPLNITFNRLAINNISPFHTKHPCRSLIEAKDIGM